MGKSLGDFIVQRRDQLIAYQLAVVHDDIEQGVTEVVRGSDLIDSTPYQLDSIKRSITIRLRFGISCRAGERWGEAEQANRAQSVDVSTPADNLKRALRFLGQSSPDSKETQQSCKRSHRLAASPHPKLMGRSL